MRSRASRTARFAALRAAAAALVCVLACASARAQEPWRWSGVPRVVAFADVHGAYEPLVELLRAADVVGSDLRWSGGTTHVVSLGDLTDRGPDVRRVLDLVMRLEREAADAGGRFHVVLGNHEVMNLLGDFRYVPAAEYAAFAGDEREPERAAAYAAFAAAEGGGDSAALRARFDAAYPRGYFARRAAFAAGGRYGAWLAARPVIIVINDTAYLHGGLSPLVAAEGLALNTRAHDAIAGYLERRERLAPGALSSILSPSEVEAARVMAAKARGQAAQDLEALVAFADAPVLGGDGPLWYRGSVSCKPLLEQRTFDAALARLGAARAVVGHTPTGDRRVRALYDGTLVAADTGMLAESYGGRPSAFVQEGSNTYVQYAAPAQRVELRPSGDVVAYGRPEPSWRDALEHGAVTAVDRAPGDGTWHVKLRHADGDAEATFYPRGSGRTADFVLAAAALDDLLGTRLVAPTVARAIDGSEGALQLRYPDAVTETDRVAHELAFSGWCPLQPQLQLMYGFDLLAANRGRSGDDLVFVNSLTELTVAPPDDAFGTARALPAGFEPRRITLPPPFVAALRALDEQQLEAALGPWLEPQELRGLVARRERLLETYRDDGTARSAPR